MRKNVFAAGILMAAAIAVAGFGGMTRGMVQASAASVSVATSSNDAIKSLIAEQNTAAQNALDYVGTGYVVVSNELMPGTGHVYKVGVAPKSCRSEVLYLCAADYYCVTLDEYNGKENNEVMQFFADKRVAEASVRSSVGKGYTVVSAESLPTNSKDNEFKIGVRKNGSSKVNYYFVGKNYCVSEDVYTAPVTAAKTGQNPIMNFIGSYSNGRGMMAVTAKGADQATIKVSWSSSAAEHSEWTMSGKVRTVGDCLIVDYNDCTKETIGYAMDGTLMKDFIEYTNGDGSLTFHYNDVIWSDYEENIADGAVFTYYNSFNN